MSSSGNTVPRIASTAQPGSGPSRLQRIHLVLALLLAAWVAMFFFMRFLAVQKGGALLPWDASWYAKVIRDGYSFNGDPSQQQNVAFLPLFPLTLRLLAHTGIDLGVLMPVASALFAVVGTIFLFLALERLKGEKVALATIVLFVTSPFSMYFMNGYSESLYLLLLGIFFYALTCRESRYAAALTAGIASAVRPHAVVLWIVYFSWEMSRRDDSVFSAARRIAAVTPLFFSGLLATEIFFYARFGDLGLYANIMGAWGFDPIISGWGAVVQRAYLQLVALSDIHPGLLLSFPPDLGKAMLAIFVVMAIFLARRVPLVIRTYGISLALFCVVATESAQNLGRHLCSNIALPMLVAGVMAAKFVPARSTEFGKDASDRSAVFWTIIIVLSLCAGALQANLIWRYYHGEWVS